jgi:hypothetical protein
MLCANLALNNLTNTHVYPFNLKTDKTLDSFNLPRCQFIKLDASGKEWNVLQGATETIKKYHPFLYVKNEWEDKTLIQFVQSLGYKLYWHMPSIVNKANFYNNPANIYARALITKNMFCVPEGLNVTMQGFREIEC